MIRIVLHRLDGIYEIAWASDVVVRAEEIHRELMRDGRKQTETYQVIERTCPRPTIHFKQTGVLEESCSANSG